MLDAVIIENVVGCTVRPVSLRDDEEMYKMSRDVSWLYSGYHLRSVSTSDTFEIRVLYQLAV